MSDERDQELQAKLEELYGQVQRRYPSGMVADEARGYYEQASNMSGDEKLYFMRLLASMLEDF